MAKSVHLILPGGGALGVFQAGFLQALKESDVVVKSISGTSVGALNASLYVMKHDDPNFHFWTHMWSKIKKRQHVFADQSLWYYIKNIFSFVSVWNSYPLKKLIDEIVDYDKFTNSPIDITCNSLDLKTGQICELKNKEMRVINEYGYFSTTHTITKEEELVKGILASGSLPLMVQPIELFGRLLVDGGTNNNFYWGNLTQRLGKGDEIWAVPAYEFGVYGNPNISNSLDIAKTTISVQIASNTLADYQKFVTIYPKHKRFVPNQGIGPDDILDFDPAKMKHGFDHGYAIGKVAIQGE